MSTAYREGSDYDGKTPVGYDIFGFPIGVRYQFQTSEGYTIPGYQLKLKTIYGRACGGRNRGKIISLKMHPVAMDYFLKMRETAMADNVILSICSAYRSHALQTRLKRARPLKAEVPGYSEHQLGTAIDIRNVKWGNKNYRWLTKHAHRFGFILTYYRGRGTDTYVGEANHWRFVGIEPAKQFYNRFKKYY